jgi:hypothetical protein
MNLFRFRSLAGSLSFVAVVVACGSSSSSDPPPGVIDAGARGPEQTGQSCATAADCYGGVDGGADGGGLLGEVQCLDRVPNGYCTHLCNTDDDCCAVPGECLRGLKQVCAPFESTGKRMCFVSCEDDDIRRAIEEHGSEGYYDGGAVESGSSEDAYCRSYASVYATCRSTGGGAANRKVCIPQQ